MPVFSPHRTYAVAREKWDRCRDAYSGSDAVKKRAQVYLPILEGHTSSAAPAYLGYLLRALFYPAMPRTVAGLAGLIFGKPATVSDLPKLWEDDFKDVTLTGVPLGGLGLILAQEILITGRGGLLIDMPDDGAPDARPYWVPFAAESIINWRASRINGELKLTLVVLAEEIEVLDDKDFFQPKTALQYRVLQLTNGIYSVTIYKEDSNKKGTWIAETVKYPLRRKVALNYIPFIIFGPTGTDCDVDHPPLLDLVDVNLSHYRTSADQEHGAHFTALPTPYITGHTVPPGETLAVGSGTAWVLPNPQATAGMVEFSGAGLKSLAELKEEKRLLMVTLGARMLETQKNAAEASATVAMRHAGERSAMTVLADTLSQVLTTAIRWHLYWRGVDDAAVDKVSIKLNPDVMDQLTAQDIQALVSAWQAGAISHKTVYYNLQWGEWTRPEVEFEEEQKDIEEEVPEPLDLPPGVVPFPSGDPRQKTPPEPGAPGAPAPGGAK
jgi:hypothetical protein